jgi:hypothetical protein
VRTLGEDVLSYVEAPGFGVLMRRVDGGHERGSANAPPLFAVTFADQPTRVTCVVIV